ncbi:hypothetical protein DENSPDRAFT_774402, partial [Dentipellis sp. KUC8613]
LVFLHGGLKLSHTYLLPHVRLYDQLGSSIVSCDQLGCGRSTHLTDKPPSFWTIDLFLTELEYVMTYFGIADGFSLIWHAWGGVLAVEYAMSRISAGLKHVVLADTRASRNFGMHRAYVLEEDMGMKEGENATASGDRQEVMRRSYQHHICRLESWPPT